MLYSTQGTLQSFYHPPPSSRLHLDHWTVCSQWRDQCFCLDLCCFELPPSMCSLLQMAFVKALVNLAVFDSILLRVQLSSSFTSCAMTKFGQRLQPFSSVSMTFVGISTTGRCLLLELHQPSRWSGCQHLPPWANKHCVCLQCYVL